MKKTKIAIIGTRGIPAAYGGFETFAEEVAIRLVEKKIDTIVIGDASNSFVETNYKGVQITNSKYSKPANPLAFYYDSLKMARQEGATFALMCGVGGSLVIPFFRNKGMAIAVNPDGLGFKRDKYVWWKKAVFFSQYLMASIITKHIVCDSVGIKSYYQNVFKRRKNISVIEYGTYLNPFCEEGIDLNKALSKFNYEYKSSEFHLVVSRLEPENNVETIIKGYLASEKKFPLVIVGNTNTKHAKDLVRYKNKNIHFIEGIYNKEQLMTLRAASLTYLHGHSVGGTNPSLLEAMGSKNCCICHDNEFNREVIQNSGLFFSIPLEVSNHIVTMEQEKNESELMNYKKGVYNRAINYYNWNRITNDYLKLAQSFSN